MKERKSEDQDDDGSAMAKVDDDPRIQEFYDIVDSDEERSSMKDYSIPSSIANSVQDFVILDDPEKAQPLTDAEQWILKFREIQTTVDLCEEAEKPEKAKQIFKENYPWPEALPESLMDLFPGVLLDGDCGRSQNDRPDWLDMDKFQRGQKFARDHLFGVFYAEMLSLMIMFSFHDGLDTLILTGKSSTPYTAFKRYLSTSTRVRRWYSENPWAEGSGAYKDVKKVRAMHENVRKKLATIDKKELRELTKIEDPWSTIVKKAKRDFESACPAPVQGQCPYMQTKDFPDDMRIKGLSQAEMGFTQFAFFALVVMYPEKFGIHDYTDGDLDDFCHVWRGLGYLLGVRDEFNVCRGSLEEIRVRCNDFFEYLVKPNFREVTPEWEHMTRCVIAGMQYYCPGSTFESSLIYLAETLNLHTPRLTRRMSFKTWLRHKIRKFFFAYAVRIKRLANFCNLKLNLMLDKALKYDKEKHSELQKRSDETQESYRKKREKKKLKCFKPVKDD